MEAESSRNVEVETIYGAVRGRVAVDANVFRGVPYGATTAPPRRFMPPTRPQRWDGVRDAFDSGPMAIQAPMSDRTYREVYRGLYPPELYALCSPLDGMSEDCLSLDLWSPSVGRGDKHPVMVWLHPGAFWGWRGSSAWADGGNLARRGEVVVVAPNHRLGVFGYLHLGDFADSRYRDAGAAGMLDIVAALTWVRENIEAFGGDPDNVTVFGNSGGSWKVSTLLAMPAAAGLFHRAIIQSSVAVRTTTPDEGRRAATSILARLGLGPGRLDELQSIAPQRLLEALGSDPIYPAAAAPALPSQPFDPAAPAISSHVPLLVGCTGDDSRYYGLGDDPPRPQNLEEVHRLIVARQRHGFDAAVARDAIDRFMQLHPDSAPLAVYLGVLQAGMQDDVTLAAERKAALGQAPVYVYRFDWKAPGFGGVYGACHAFDVFFAFDNLRAAPQLCGADPDPLDRELAARMSGAWIAFARSGDPSHPGLPSWAPYTPEARATMILDRECTLASDPARAERLAFADLRRARLPNIGRWTHDAD